MSHPILRLNHQISNNLIILPIHPLPPFKIPTNQNRNSNELRYRRYKTSSPYGVIWGNGYRF